nr:MAG TPA: hypothetical protein [Caudoviricetes sp.]
MVLYPNKLPESERVCSGICNLMMLSTRNLLSTIIYTMTAFY